MKSFADYQWTNPSQPQTLNNAVILMYLFAVLSLLSGDILGAALLAFGGLGTANDKKWGYGIALIAAFLPLVIRLSQDQRFKPVGILGLLFDVVLVALLVHRESRNYVKLWFR